MDKIRKTATLYAVDERGEFFRVATYARKVAKKAARDIKIANTLKAQKLCAVDDESGKIIQQKKYNIRN